MSGLDTSERAVRALMNQGRETSEARAVVGALAQAGISLADDHADELVCRWVDVVVRPVPADADTIIRTITKTVDGVSYTTTHWLEGLRSPRV
ncbi:MAG: hypothetical protein ABW252_21285 [Polyangiales bacterium]